MNEFKPTEHKYLKVFVKLSLKCYTNSFCRNADVGATLEPSINFFLLSPTGIQGFLCNILTEADSHFEELFRFI